MFRRLIRPDRIAAVIVAVILFSAAASLPATAASHHEPSLVVDLNEDGSAVVTTTFIFDLTDEDEQGAFEALADDADAREGAKLRFQDRMQSIANDAENATDREMEIQNPTIDISTDGDTGIIALSVTWTGLAAHDGDRLVIEEPFASGFTTDRDFTVTAPDGHEVSEVTPTPDEQTDETVTWHAGTTFDGLTVTIAPSDAHQTTGETGDSTDPGDTGATETGGQPGFGMIAALVALVGGTLAVYHRRKR